VGRLAIIVESALCHELDPGPAGERYQVVHVERPRAGGPDAPMLDAPDAPGQPLPKGACTFPLKRPAVWPGTPAVL
jgi:hypothetical protein